MDAINVQTINSFKGAIDRNVFELWEANSTKDLNLKKLYAYEC